MDLGVLNLGLELDLARRARYSPPSLSSSPTSSTATTELDPESPENSSLPLPISISTLVDGGRDTSSAAAQDKVEQERERPYPLCLLCLSRPPSAVLLPCCHLNLCYLCAPMLILRTSTSHSLSLSHDEDAISATATDDLNTSTSTSPPPAPSEPRNIPYNVLLARATAHNPKLRRLAGGGYSPPSQSNGLLCGEMRAEQLIPSAGGENDDEERVLMSTFSDGDGDNGNGDGNGRICLISPEKKETTGQRIKVKAKCLVCRQGVDGWLRVYSG